MKHAQKIKHSLLSKAIAFSWVLLVLSMLSPLINANYYYFTNYFIAVFAFFYLFFYGGMLFSVKNLPAIKVASLNANSIKYMYLLLILISIGSRLIDRLWIRSPDNLFSIVDVRESRMVGSNLFSIISSLLSPLVLIIYDFLRRRFLLSRKVIQISYVNFFIVVLDTFFSGSRGILLIYTACLWGGKLKIGSLIVFGPMLVLLSGWFFLYRYESLMPSESILSVIYFVSGEGYSYFVPVSTGFMELFSDFWSIIIFPFVQINQYVAHGIFEYAYIVEKMSIVNFEPSRIIPQLHPYFNYLSKIERSGMYYTFAGNLYVYFGVYSVIASLFFGILYGFFYKQSLKVGKGSLLIVILSIFLIPYVDSFGGYDFFIYLSSIVIISLFEVKIGNKILNK